MMCLASMYRQKHHVISDATKEGNALKPIIRVATMRAHDTLKNAHTTP